MNTVYVNKIENKITFKTKTGYYLKFVTPEMIKLLESTKNKISKDGKWEKCTSFRNYWGSISTLQHY